MLGNRNICQFVRAIEKNKFKKAEQLLARDVENIFIQPLPVFKVTILQLVTWKGNIDLVNALITKGADVNDIDTFGRTALYYAAHCGHVNITRRLLECRANINVQVKLPSSRDEKNIVQMFLPQSPFERTAYINSEDELSSSESSSDESISFSSDEDVEDFDMYSIIHELPLPTCNGSTPLHEAVRNNHADVVRILVDNGARINIGDEHFPTPLFLAGTKVKRKKVKEKVKFFRIVSLLVFAGAYVDNNHWKIGTQVLFRATELGSAKTIELLLTKVCAKTLQAHYKTIGNTPFHIAAKAGDTEALMALCNKIQLTHYDIDVRDQKNRTALHTAASHGHRDCVKILINCGADLTATDKYGCIAANAIFTSIWEPVQLLTDIFDSSVAFITDNSLDEDEDEDKDEDEEKDKDKETEVLVIFGFLIVGVALRFATVFHGNEDFGTFGKALISTVLMIMGEYEYTDVYKNNTSTDNKQSEHDSSITVRIIFCSFIIVIICTRIVLIKLMTDLAVSDIQAFKKKDCLRQLVKQAEFIAQLEKLMVHKIVYNVLIQLKVLTCLWSHIPEEGLYWLMVHIILIYPVI